MDLELLRLKTDAFEKLDKFQVALHKSMLYNLSLNPSVYEFAKLAKELEGSSSEGIEYGLAVEKLNKYREEHGVNE